MKRNDELLTRAQLIRNETQTDPPANTAERVGEHLEDMVDRMGKSDIRQYDSEKPHITTPPPMVCLKYDYMSQNWLGMPKIVSDHWGSNVPLTFFSPPAAIQRPEALFTSDKISFTAPAGETKGTIQTSDETADWTQIFEPRMIISVNNSNNNNNKVFPIAAVTADTLTLEGTAQGYANNATTEAEGASITVYNGRYGEDWLTFADLASLIQGSEDPVIPAGNAVGCYAKTGHPLSESGAYRMLDDDELWIETAGAKAEMEAGLLAAGCEYSVDMLVAPGGANDERSHRFARAAGFKLCTGVCDDTHDDLPNSDITNPYQMQEMNVNPLCNPDDAVYTAVWCVADSFTLNGSGTTFTNMSPGDLIVVAESDGGWAQLRTIETIESDTELTVTSKFVTTISDSEDHDGVICNPLTEDFNSNSYIGFINHIIEQKTGWCMLAGHAGSVSSTTFRKTKEAACLDYIKLKIAAGEDIRVASLSEVADTYAPLFEAGGNFSVGQGGVCIEKAKSAFLTLDTTTTKIGYRAGFGSYGTGNTFVGCDHRIQIATTNSTFIGCQAGNCAIGYNGGSACTFIGYRAGYYNKGNNVVAIGDQAGYYNTESNVFYVAHKETAGATPLIKGYFKTGGIILGAPSYANRVADDKIDPGRFSVSLSSDGNSLEFRVCTGTGTYKTGSVAIS